MLNLVYLVSNIHKCYINPCKETMFIAAVYCAAVSKLRATYRVAAI